MSQLTNWGENTLIDFYIRAVSTTFPTNWYIGLASAAAEGSITELTGTGYARQPIARSLTAWSATQSLSSVATSTGTTHRTSNINQINFGNAGSAWGTANALVLYDALSGGNAFIYAPISGGFVIGNGDEVLFGANSLIITVGLTGGMTDYFSNRVIDEVFRGVALTKPSSLYMQLLTSAPTNAGGGTEVSATGYARVPVARSLSAWAGTQGAGTTVASTGTGGITSNNADIVWATPSSSWGTVNNHGIMDAVTGGNRWFWSEMDTAKSVVNGSPAPRINAGGLQISFQ